MGKEAQEFLDALKNAKSERSQDAYCCQNKNIVEASGLSKDRLKEVEVDVSDYLE